MVLDGAIGEDFPYAVISAVCDKERSVWRYRDISREMEASRVPDPVDGTGFTGFSGQGGDYAVPVKFC